MKEHMRNRGTIVLNGQPVTALTPIPIEGKRLIVNGTDDPFWTAAINPVDRPTFTTEALDVASAVKQALTNRTDLQQAQKQLAALLKLSPLSMAITLEQLKRCANRSFEDTMTIEYRMSQACMRPDHDFFEGVRALLIDKDQAPKWNPPTIEGVTREMVEAHFKPVANDLFFDSKGG